MSQDYASCVLIKGELVGFICMPVSDFVFIPFAQNRSGLSLDAQVPASERYCYSPLGQPLHMPVGVKPLIAVGEELRIMCERFNVPFMQNVSELMSYEVKYAGRVQDVNFRFADVRSKTNIVRSFIGLVNTWFDANVRKFNPDLKPAEIRLIDDMLSEFWGVVDQPSVSQYGWSEERQRIMQHALAPSKSRMVRVVSDDYEENEELMLKYGYHHVW